VVAVLVELEHVAHAQLAQQQRADRDALQAQEVDQEAEQVPGAARHIEQRIVLVAARAVAQRPVEAGHALEGLARVGVGARQHQGHVQLVGDIGPQDRVVDVADDAEAGARPRH
jgi:hypothetical protein